MLGRYFPGVPHDDAMAPATKDDIRLLMEQIGKLYDANARWKEEIIGQFDLTVESIRHELKAAHHDSVELLNDQTAGHASRIKQLEGCFIPPLAPDVEVQPSAMANRLARRRWLPVASPTASE